jgi:hypothetical protein
VTLPSGATLSSRRLALPPIPFRKIKAAAVTAENAAGRAFGCHFGFFSGMLRIKHLAGMYTRALAPVR